MLLTTRISTVEFSKFMPARPIVESLEGEWPGLIIRTYRLPAGEAALPAVPDLCIQQQLSLAVTNVERILGTKRQTARLTSGSLTFMPADQPSYWRWDNAVDLMHIHISREAILQLTEHKSSVTQRIEAMDHINITDSLLANIGRTILEQAQYPEWSRNAGHSDSLTRTLILQIVRLFADSIAAKPARQSEMRQVQRSLNYIHANLEKELTLQKLASIAHVSAFHFVRMFRSDLGITPHRYIIEQRISRAQVLLSCTSLAIAEVSRRIGFSSQSHFTRAFHEEIGMTPKVYRWSRTRRVRTAGVN